MAGISDDEFDLPFIHSLKARGLCCSADMQSFVRQADMATGEISFLDVASKSEIVRLLDFVKLDVVESEILAGTAALEESCLPVLLTGAPGENGYHPCCCCCC